MEQILEVPASEFDREVKELRKPVVVEFWKKHVDIVMNLNQSMNNCQRFFTMK